MYRQQLRISLFPPARHTKATCSDARGGRLDRVTQMMRIHDKKVREAVGSYSCVRKPLRCNLRFSAGAGHFHSQGLLVACNTGLWDRCTRKTASKGYTMVRPEALACTLAAGLKCAMHRPGRYLFSWLFRLCFRRVRNSLKKLMPRYNSPRKLDAMRSYF